MAGPLDSFRAQFPGAYDDVPDEVLAERIRKTYYAKEDPAAYWQFVGLRPPQSALERFVTDPLIRGAARAGQGLAAVGADAGLISPETASSAIGAAEQIVQNRRPSTATTKALQEIGNAPDFTSAAGAALRNPGALAETAVESVGQSAPGIAVGVAGGVAGGVPGAIAGFGLGAGAVEYMASVQDAWREAGVDPANPQQLAAALRDPAAMAKAREYATRRAIPIGVFSAISGGLAGRLVAGAQGARSAAMRGTAELGLQSGLEGAGEATAGYLSKGEVKPGDVVMEAAAGIPGGIPEIAVGAYNARQRPALSAQQEQPAQPQPAPVPEEPYAFTPYGEPVLDPFGTPFSPEPQPFEPGPDYVPPPQEWQPSPFTDAEPEPETYDIVPSPLTETAAIAKMAAAPKQAILPVPTDGPLGEALAQNQRKAMTSALMQASDPVAAGMAQPKPVDPMARGMSPQSQGFPRTLRTEPQKPPSTGFVRRVEPATPGSEPAPAPATPGTSIRDQISAALQSQPFSPEQRAPLVQALRALNRGDVVEHNNRQVEILALPPPEAKSGVVKAREIATGKALAWPSLPAFMRGVKAPESASLPEIATGVSGSKQIQAPTVEAKSPVAQATAPTVSEPTIAPTVEPVASREQPVGETQAPLPLTGETQAATERLPFGSPEISRRIDEKRAARAEENRLATIQRGVADAKNWLEKNDPYNRKIPTFGWSSTKLADLPSEDVTALRQRILSDEANYAKDGLYILNKPAQKKIDALAWATTYQIQRKRSAPEDQKPKPAVIEGDEFTPWRAVKSSKPAPTPTDRPLADFLASTGGINVADRRETAMEGQQWMIPKAGPLWRKNAKGLDYARERAVEAGYLRPDATVEDLVRALDRDRAAWSTKNKEQRVYPGGDAVEDTGKRQDEEQARLDMRMADVRDHSAKNGYELTEREMRSIAETMLVENMDASDATDRFIENDADDVRAEHQDNVDSGEEIPLDLPDQPAPRDEGPAPQESRARNQEPATPARRTLEDFNAELRANPARGSDPAFLAEMRAEVARVKAERGKAPAPVAVMERPASGKSTAPISQPKPEPVATAPRPAPKKNTERMREAAQRAIDAADSDIGRDRLSNTARRARIAANSLGDAARRKQEGKTLLRIADAIDAGEAGLLENVSSLKDVERLRGDLSRARSMRTEWSERQKLEGQPYTTDDVDRATFYGTTKFYAGTAMKALDFIKDSRGRTKKGYSEVEPLLRRVANDGAVTPTPELVKVLEDMGERDTASRVKEKLTDNNAYARLGITDSFSLQKVLGEFIKFVSPKQQTIDPIRTRIQEAARMNIAGYFPTPKPLIEDVIAKADIRPGMRVLEPSAGTGDLAMAAKDAGGTVETAEISPTLAAILKDRGLEPVASDFMGMTEGGYDRIVMNPPFERGQDIDHVRKAYDLLRPGGRVVAIMSEGPFFRQDKKASEFRDWLDGLDGTSEKNPEGSFKNADRSTGVATRTVVIDKPGVQYAVSRPTPAFARDRSAIVAEATALAKRINPAVRVEAVDQIFDVDGVQFARSGGKAGDVVVGTFDPSRSLVRVALNQSDKAIIGVASHEAFHSISPLLTDAQRAVLERGVPVSGTRTREEDFAYGFQSYMERAQSVPMLVRPVFFKLREFVSALGSLLKGRGFRTPESVFEKVRKGDVAKQGSAVPAGDVQYAVAPAPIRPDWIAHSEPDGAYDRIRDATTGGLYAKARDWWLSEGITQLVDKFQPILQLGRRIMTDDPGHLHRLVEFAANDAGAIQAVMEAGAPTYNPERMVMELAEGSEGLAPIMTRHLKGAPNTEERQRDAYKAGAYRYAKRAQRLKAEGRENLLSAADINKALDVTPEERERYDAMWSDYDRHNRQVLDFAVKTGVVKADAAAEWSAYGDYVPFYRVMEDEGELIGPREYYAGINNPDPKIKKLKGGTSKLGDPYENVARNTRALISAGRRNIALREIAKALVESGEGRFVPMSGDTKNTILLYENGEKKRLQVDDPTVAASLMALGPQRTNGILRMLQTFAQVYRAGVTLTPTFAIANMLRDIPSAYIQTDGASFTAKRNAVTKLADAYKGSTNLSELRAITGFGGTQYSSEGSLFQPSLAEAVGTKRTGAFKTWARNTHNALEKLSQATEWSGRLAIYENLIAKGVPKERAAYEAMNVINFGRSGANDTVRMLTQLVPFLNARIQGLARMFETQGAGFGTAERKRLIKQLFVRGAILSAATAAIFANYTDEDWEKYDEESIAKRAGYHIIYAGDRQITIPKAFEWGTIFSTLPEALIRSINGNHDGELAKIIKHTLANTFAFNPIPQAILPALETYVNYDMFQGRDLEPQYLSRFLPEERAMPSTSVTAQGLARVLPGGLSPIQVQHLVEGYGGAAAQALLFAFDGAAGAAGMAPEKPSGAFGDGVVGKALDPILGRFFRDSEVAPAEMSIQKLYDIKKQADQAYTTATELMRRGEVERAKQLMTEHAKPIAMRKQLDRTANQLALLTKQARQIRLSPSMDADEKRRLMNEITSRKNEIARRQVALLKAA